MKKKINLSMVLTTIICLLPVILSVILYSQLPDKIPIHFNISGQPDNYAAKFVACFILPFAFAILNLFVHFILNSDPKKANSSETMKTISKWIIPVLSVICLPISLFLSLGKNIPVHIIIPALVGVLILVCGNYLPKNRQNYTVGIKLPWTLHSEENWNKTHRMAGFLWMIGGAIIIIISFFQFINIAIVLVIVIILTIVPVIYSYILYRRES